MAETEFAAVPSPPPAPKPRHRKLFLLLGFLGILAGVFVLVILAVLAAPTLISSGPVVGFALKTINKNLNGKIEIASVSLGWFTGAKIEGVKVLDQQGVQIAELDHVVVPFPLWKAITAKFDLGDVIVDGLSFDAKYDSRGQLNFSQLARVEPSTPKPAPASASPAPTETQPTRLPTLSGHIKLTNIHGTISGPGKPTVYLTKLDGDINIPDINSPITDQIDAAIKVADHEATFTASGTAAVITDNQINFSNGGRSHQTVDIKNLDLQLASPFLSDNVGIETLQGTLDFHLNADVEDRGRVLVDAAITSQAPIAIGGSKFKGDVLRTNTFSLQLPHLTADVSNGTDRWKSAKISIGATTGSEPASIKIDQGQITLAGYVIPQAVLNFLNGQKPGSPGEIAINSNFDLGKIIPQFQKSLPSGLKIDSGNFNQQVTIAISPEKLDLSEKIDTTQITGTQTISGSTAKPIAVAPIHIGISTLKTANAGTPPKDVALDLSDVQLALAAKSPLNKLQSAHLQISIPDIKPIMDLADAFSAPAAVTSAKADTKPDAPLKFTSGSALITGDLTHDGPSLKLNISQIAANNLGTQRGDITYAFKPIKLTLVASADIPDSGSFEKLKISSLTGDLGVATASMPTPISVSLEPTGPIASGAIKVVGNLTDLTQMLAALQGEKADAYPYRGDYTLTENIGSQQSKISLKGGLQLAKFQSYNGETVTFSEDLLTIDNDVALTTTNADQSVTINNFTAAMQSSGAVKLALNNGTIQHLNHTRELNLHPTIDYDLAKLWPIIQPVMGDKYKTLKIAGHYQKQFNITGSYPAEQPTTIAIRPLHADGDLAVESFDYNGLTLQNFVVPFSLDNGQLVTVYPNKIAAAPATANGGTLDLGNLTIDLTQSPPRLTTPQNKSVINNLTINPLFSNTFLAKVINNPLFAGAKDASGLFSLTIDDCIALPMGDLVTLPTPENSGKIELHFSIAKLHIGLANDALQSVLKQTTFDANVNNATVAIAKGISTQHIKFATGDYTLGFDGSVRLKDQALIPMTLTFPLAAIASKTHLVRDQNVLAVLPDSLAILVEGTVSSPKYRFEKIIPKAVADATAKAVAKGLLGGNKDGNDDSLGGLLNKLGKKKH